MPLNVADRVRDTTTTTGTGTITLSGTPPTGYQSFSAVGNGNTTYYTINAGSQWEVGIGTYAGAGPTLSRDTVLASSSGGSLVDFAAGTKDVFCDYPASKSISDGFGLLPPANGGTGTATAFTAGSVVFAGASGVYTQDNTNLFWDNTNDRLGIGTPTPGAKVNIVDNSANDAIRITQTGAGNALVVEDSANPDATPFVIAGDGRSVQGHTSSINFTGASYLAEFLGSGSLYPLTGGYTGASATGPRFAFVKSRSANWSTNTIVQSGDTLGDIAFTGADGSDYVLSARILVQVDGTPGVNDMPGRIVFQTTPDSGSIPAERLRIASSGAFGLSGANYGTAGQVLTSAGSGAAPSWATPTGGINAGQSIVLSMVFGL